MGALDTILSHHATLRVTYSQVPLRTTLSESWSYTSVFLLGLSFPCRSIPLKARRLFI